MTVDPIATLMLPWEQHGMLGMIIGTLFLSQYLLFRYFIMKMMDQNRDERIQLSASHIDERKEWRQFIDKITEESMRLQGESNKAILSLTSAVEKMNARIRVTDYENHALRAQFEEYRRDK